jgi:hypothetical protein
LSARRGQRPRSLPHHPARDLELWWRAVELRTEWQGRALCTTPADRQAAESAVTGLYALLGRPRPEFVWATSPAAGLRLLPPAPPITSNSPWRLENQLASQVTALRRRLDSRIGVRRVPHFDPVQPPSDPEAALRSGVPLRTVLTEGLLDALRRDVRDRIAGPIRAEVAQPPGLVWYGQFEADWVAYYDVLQQTGDVSCTAEELAQLELWAVLARSCGWWWPREESCVLTERPVEIRTEPISGSAYGEVRLHNATGPAVVFADGWTVHAWHGTRVPSWVVDTPDAERIGWEPNVEVRRCAIENLGWTAFIDQAGLALVGQAPDPGNPGAELLLYDLPHRPGTAANRLLLAVNGSVERDGTRRKYGLHVPGWFEDPLDAAGWSYGLTGAQYAQLQRRT